MTVRRPLIVKLGSALIVAPDGRPRLPLLAKIAADLAAARARGEDVCVVSSGAIALGSRRMGLDARRRRSLDRLQAASALGQAELQGIWQDVLLPHGLLAGQVLLTAADLADRGSYLNLRAALRALLRLGAVPIVNENDATATDEITFGDNDMLAAQVAVLLNANRLILLTGVDGVLSNVAGDAATVIEDGARAREAVPGAPSQLGKGGIASKIRAAELAAAGGTAATITSPRYLAAALADQAVGTRFAAASARESAFKLWLRHGKQPTAKLEVDAGAASALLNHGRSLLAVGVLGWTKPFRAGDGVDICHPAEHPIARGISSIDASELATRRTDVEVVHRDRLVLL